MPSRFDASARVREPFPGSLIKVMQTVATHVETDDLFSSDHRVTRDDDPNTLARRFSGTVVDSYMHELRGAKVLDQVDGSAEIDIAAVRRNQ